MTPGIAATAQALGHWAGVDPEEALHGPYARLLEVAWAKGLLLGVPLQPPAGKDLQEKLKNLINRPWQP